MKATRVWFWWAFSVLGFCALCSSGQGGQAPEAPRYNRDVRPILAENCFACHGPDKVARKADLRLDQREVAVAAEAIVPGKPDKSGLIERINAEKPAARRWGRGAAAIIRSIRSAFGSPAAEFAAA
ncbi:MAG TPA: c-type cytochrome domain-containing protein [Gemmataceae bacterium]|jgi:hypothetical protein|nr:c-type cytochrome domain-containing protein [Gemmataceae bacterium]